MKNKLHKFFINCIVLLFLSTTTVVFSSSNNILDIFDLAKSGELKEALKRIDLVIEKKPKSSVAYFIKGYIQQHLKNFDSAIQFYTIAIKLDEKNGISSFAYSGRGNCWKAKWIFDKAVSDFTKVIELNPSNIIAYYDRASVWFKLSKYQAALNDYTQIININPCEIDAYAKRAIIFIKRGKWESALRDIKKIILLNSKFIPEK